MRMGLDGSPIKQSMNQEISKINEVLDLLKQKEVLYTVGIQKRYFKLIENKVWIRDEHLSVKLNVKDFIDQFSGKTFFLHTGSLEEEVNDEKDKEYYAWRDKSQ